MAMTLAAIVKTAALELGLNAPVSVVGNGDAQTQQMLALANRNGAELSQIEGGWQALRGEHLITWVVGQDTYTLPTDYLYYVQDTQWNRSSHYRIDGPMSALDWETIKSGLFPSGVYSRYRIMGNKIVFDPVPSDASVIAIEYISNSWCQSASAVGQIAFLADTDTPRLPDDLFVLGIKWRFLAAKGFDYSEERAAYDMALNRFHPRDTVTENISLGMRGGINTYLNMGLLPAGNWPGR